MTKLLNTGNNIFDYDYMSDIIPAYERCNIALLDKVLHQDHDFEKPDAGDLAQMRKIYRKACKDSGKYTPLYEQKGATYQGRVFCKTGLCALSRRWRNALAFKHYRDVDMVNAAYTMAHEIAEREGLPCEKLDDYVSNRSKWVMNYMLQCKKKGNTIDRAEGKQHYIKKLFSTKKTIIKGSLDQEIKLLQDWVYTNNPKLVKAVEHSLKKKAKQMECDYKPYNIKGKVLSHYIFNMENKILSLAIKYLKNDKEIVGGTMMDGFFMEKRDGQTLDNLNNYLKEVEKSNIKFIFKSMIDFPKNVGQTALSLDKETQLEENKVAYLELREQFEGTEGVAKIKLQNGFLILRGDGNTFVSSSALKEMYVDWGPAGEFRTNCITGKKNPSLFIENWIMDPNKRIYEDQKFVPDVNECSPKFFNTFRGFQSAIDSLTEPDITEDDEADYQNLKKYLFNLFADKRGQAQSTINYNYILNWLANIFQNPTKKSEVMLVLKGKKGIGKSDLILMLGRMLSEDYVFETRDPAREVWGSFNDAIENKILVNIDEPEGLDNARNIEKLKGAITSKTINIKKKYKNLSVDRNYVSFIMTLNEENTGIRITDDNRRFALFESATKRYTEAEYSPYYNAQRNPNALVLLYRELMNRDLTGFDFDRTTIPQTDFLIRSKKNSIKNYHAFLEQLLIDKHTQCYSQIARRGNGSWIVLCGNLYKGYTRFCESSGDMDYQSKVKNQDFKREMVVLDGVVDRHTSHKPTGINGQCYIIDPSLLKDNLIDLGLTVTADEVTDSGLNFIEDPVAHGLDN